MSSPRCTSSPSGNSSALVSPNAPGAPKKIAMANANYVFVVGGGRNSLRHHVPFEIIILRQTPITTDTPLPTIPLPSQNKHHACKVRAASAIHVVSRLARTTHCTTFSILSNLAMRNQTNVGVLYTRMEHNSWIMPGELESV